MELELQKYEIHSNEYMIYDCNRNHYKFGEREARVMCSQSIGLETRKIIVGPIIKGDEVTLVLYNPDGSISEPQTDDIRVFVKYLDEAGYERMSRSDSGATSSDEVHRVCRMAFFENFVQKYNLQKAE